jgi:uncharacterized protein (DUF2384 family)
MKSVQAGMLYVPRPDGRLAPIEAEEIASASGLACVYPGMSLLCPIDVSPLRQKGGRLTTTLTPEERLDHADQELQELKDSFVEALGHLDKDQHVDDSFHERLEDIQQRLRELRHGLSWDDLDKAQIAEFHSALWEIKDLIDDRGGEYDLDTVDRLLVCIERVRHVIRDALDEHVAGAPEDAGLAIQELRERLPNTSMATLGQLVGVDRKTLSRWTKAPRAASRRLQLVARLVAILRHNWTERGIIAWFERPRRSLGGRKPFSLLDDPLADELLIEEARSGRSQDAT